MQSLRIHGGISLSGVVRAGGSKNATLPIMAASILADGPVLLEGVPRLRDVDTLAQVLGELGVHVLQLPPDRLLLETVDPSSYVARYDLVRRMRAGFCVLGPLLAKRKRAVVSLPGGCKIGPRPVDLHLAGLAAMGARLRFERGYVVAETSRLTGARVHLAGPRGPTVTGTANILSAAVLADGVTTITGAAVEPEIVDLGRFLNQMGACIQGLGTPTLRVQGVTRLDGASYRVIPDRIEAATLLLAAAVTQGCVTVSGTVPSHLGSVLGAFDQAGFRVQVSKDRVTVEATGAPRPMDARAEPYPGIPSDLQAQWMAVLSLAEGRSTVQDHVFPSRFLHVDELVRLGARIELRDWTAVVDGVPRLAGTAVNASDLRASAALVLAGLAAEGVTEVRQIHHLDRGYERLEQKLNRLGARICRVGKRGKKRAGRIGSLFLRAGSE